MSPLKNYNVLPFEEFEELLWDYVSDKIISTKYLDEYSDFIENLTFDLYSLHLKSGIEINILGKIMEQFFFNLFRFPSSCEDFQYSRKIDLG